MGTAWRQRPAPHCALPASRGWAGRLPLRLRVVAVSVLGRRRLGLLARSPRRGLGARPLRCLPPAPAPGDRIPRQQRRLRERTAAQGLPRRPPHCCSRSLAPAAALLRGPAQPSPGSRSLSLSQAAPLPAPGPSPALTCVCAAAEGATSGGAATPPSASGALGRPGGLGA
ncbi:bcl-2-binding component 3, isoforms 3/4-like [Pseudorca crassidens]|uniref:bcl-2-binding component 3, isoforms 3/4-like n=1 Tax=Pseudorca crassidens TaxID=82174 RepID=UPI00352E7AF7